LLCIGGMEYHRAKEVDFSPQVVRDQEESRPEWLRISSI
jgi:hypothetical protein